MNAIANIATRAPRFAGSTNYAFTSRRTKSRSSSVESRQTIYAVREVTVTRHSFRHIDAHYVIFA